MWRRCAARGSSLSISRWRIAAQPSPARSSTLSSIEWVTAKCDVERLGRRGDESLEGVLGPVHEALRRLRLDDLALLLRVVAGLGHGLRRSRSRDRAPARPRCPRRRSPARPARPAIWWNSRALSSRGVVPSYLRQLREQHGADGHVDADAERVGAADDLEVAVLREPLDQQPVLRQHAGVVHADAVAHEPRQRLAEAGREPEAARWPRRWRPSRSWCRR